MVECIYLSFQKEKKCIIREETFSHFSRSVVSDSLWSLGLWPTGLLCPWKFPGKDTEVGFHFSRGPSWPRDWTQISCTTGRFFTIWATRESDWTLINFLFTWGWRTRRGRRKGQEAWPSQRFSSILTSWTFSTFINYWRPQRVSVPVGYIYGYLPC